jgi:hypothetical protein
MYRSSLFAFTTAIFLCYVALDAFGLQAEPRLWKDTTGQFQVRATLVEQTDSAVRLQTADGREITVPMNRLSQADQDYLQGLKAPKDNPFAGGTPMPKGPTSVEPAPSAVVPGTLRSLPESDSLGEEMALPGTGSTLNLTTGPSNEPFAPDPQPTAPSIPSAVVPVSDVDAYDKISVPVVADSKSGRFLISIGRNKSGSPEETRGRIYTVDLAAKEAQLVWDHPSCVSVLDHDAQSGRTLIVDKLDQFQRGGELVMVEGLETGSPQTLYRRTLPGAGKPGFAPQVEWARLLSGSHVAAIVDRKLCVWNMPAAKLVYLIETASASEPPVFSGNKVYMAVPQGGRIVVIETASGEVRKSFATGSTLTPGAAFHPDGRNLALCFSNQYQVWDCVADSIVSEATTTDHLSSHPIHWIGPKLFRGAMGDTIHMDLGMSVWKYYISGSTEPIVLSDKIVTATTSRNCTLLSAEIPHASAANSINKLMRAGDAAMLVRPGSAVAIAVDAAVKVDQGEIKASLAEAAEKAGWTVSNRAPVTLVAKIGRGETRELQFRSLGPGPRKESTANLTPFTAELQIRSGADVLWSRKTENRIPPMLHLEEGETVQDAVNRYEKPDAAFFARLNLPPRIPKPEISEHIGMSSLKDGKWQEITVNRTRPR